MTRSFLLLTTCAFLAACQGVPERPATGGDTGGGTGGDGTDGGNTGGTGGSISGDGSVMRYEERDGKGGGYVEAVSYDATNDRFLVDGIAFDGEVVPGTDVTAYDRDPDRPTLGGASQYRSVATVRDSGSGAVIDQFDYRALYGRSTNSVGGTPRTQFAIVRTGDYAGYGFGGFVYERNGAAVLPDGGQVQFSGSYSGVRIFDDSTGMELVEGNAVASVDFDDFNAADAVRLEIVGRTIMTPDGTVLTSVPDTTLSASLVGDAPVLNAEGEMTGEMNAFMYDPDSDSYENVTTSGRYYGVIAGDVTDPADGGELVGVIVVEYKDFPDNERGNVQETGGFILYR